MPQVVLSLTLGRTREARNDMGQHLNLQKWTNYCPFWVLVRAHSRLTPQESTVGVTSTSCKTSVCAVAQAQSRRGQQICGAWIGRR